MRPLQMLSVISTLLVLAIVPAAYAATISYGGTTQVANNGSAPGSASNYDFGDFGGGGQPTHLTNFSVSIPVGGQFGGTGGYTNVIAPGGSDPFLTGIAFDNSCHCGETSTIATFTSTLSDFAVYILDGNTDGNVVGNSDVGLMVNGVDAQSASTIYDGDNEFTEFIVHGAVGSDTFQVFAKGSSQRGGNYPSLGGLTFSALASPVPEPSSLMLLGTGVLGGLGALRRKFKA